jgi:hypothetical protein
MSAAADCQEALEDLAAAVESSEAAAAFKARGNLRAALSGDFRNSAWLLLAFIIPAIDSNSPGDCRRPG